MTRSKKKLVCFIAFLLVSIALLSASVYTTFAPTAPKQASADAVVGDRIEMIDLFRRYPIDAVIGPIDVKDINNDGVIDRNDLNSTGHFTYFEDAAHTDINGNYTNNIYQIPANRYFDVESYIYTTGEKDSAEGRTLYGWNPAIRGVDPGDTHKTVAGSNNGAIAENGEILNGGYLTSSAAPIGIYAYFGGGNYYGSTYKYTLIVPEDITIVGQGSAAFVGYDSNNILSSYYGTGGTGNTYTSGDNMAAFTDFSSFYSCGNNPLNNAPYCWQPRERLAGVFFPENSRLTTIMGSKDDTAGEHEMGRSWPQSNGKAAFQDCNNMRFMVLPSGVTSIGNHAFYRCSQLVDTNIPSNVESIGYFAYNECSSLLHISIPDKEITWKSKADGTTYRVFGNCSKLKHVENYQRYTVGTFATTGSTIFVMGNAPQNGTLDTGAFVFEQTSAGKLSALSLAGETGENPNKLFVFPSASHFTDTDDRRRGVTYDYLDCDGKKVKNSLDTVSATEYDVADKFAEGTWCQNVILPKEVKTIGEDAFNISHVKYLETYATTIKANAFKDDNSNNANQWFYFHQIKKNGSFTKYDIASSAFVAASSNVAERHIVFETQELYTFATSTNTTTSGNFRANVINKTPATSSSACKQYVQYLIPITAHITNESSQTVTIDQSDMENLFYIDSDCKEEPVSVATGVAGSITYTKRLSNSVAISSSGNYYSKSQSYSYEVVKQRTGEWKQDPGAAAKNTSPVLSNMVSTKWYTDTTYEVETDASKSHSGSKTSIDLYTKNIGAPTLSDQVYQYNKDVSADEYLTLYRAVKLPTSTADSDFLTGTTADFTSFTGISRTASVVQDAGTYIIPIILNSDKWGVWDTETRNYSIKVTVNRAEFDLGNVVNLPTFYSGSTSLGGTDDGTTIYRYNDSESKTVWYLYPFDSNYLGTETVLNSFVRHTGNEITIRGESSNSAIYTITSHGGNSRTDSGDMNADFSLHMENPNYVFSTASYQENLATFQKLGISFKNTSAADTATPQVDILKHWYIVVQTNWLIDSDAAADSTEPYALLTYNGEATSTVPYEATFGDGAYKVHFPKLARGTASIAITFTMTYGSAATPITPQDGIDVSYLENYVNSAMPAGTYTITVSAPSTIDPDDPAGQKELPAVRDIIRLTVTPKEIPNKSTVIGLLGTLQTKSFNHVYDADKVFLYDATTQAQLQAFLTAIDNGLNTERKNAADGNVWKDDRFKSYYEETVKITYNLDRMQSTKYYTFDDLSGLNPNVVPSNVGQYIVYYSLSAKNYQSVGGENETDRRDYSFNTTIYRELSLISIANTIRATDYTYNGGVINANVPYSAFYTYAFSGDRTNATKSDSTNKPTVTLTITEPALTRWASISDDSIVIRENGTVADITYTIQQTTNYWISPPQVPAWSYDGFTPEVHTIIGTLAYSAAAVYYRIGVAEAVGNNVQYLDPINVNGTLQINGVVDPTYFRVGANGILEDDPQKTIQNILKALDVLPSEQFYYLEYYVFDTEDGNVEGISGPSPFRIYLTKAQNYWETTPALTPYQYTQFRQDFIAGIPHYSSADKVTYAVYNGNTKLADLPTFIDTEDNDTIKLTEDAIEALNQLTVGSYRIRVSLDGDTNYNEMPAYQIPFSIMQAQANTWKDIPGISSWTYSGYSESLLTEGTADFGTVYYTVQTLDADGNINGNLANFADLSFTAMKTKLATLDAGSYNLFVTSKGATTNEAANFVAAERNVRFSVAKAQNEWATTPSISGWTYGEAPKTPTLGAAKYEYDATKVKREYYTAQSSANGTWGYDKTETPLSMTRTTKAGDYVYVTTVPETTNYLELVETVHFAIARASNRWETGCEPEGTFTWTWGKTEDVLTINSGFAKAAAVQMTADKKVTYVIAGTNYLSTVEKTKDTNVQTALIDELKKLNVGNYQIVVAVTETENYEGVSKVTYVTVNPASFEWQKEPADSGWTWGVADAQKTFAEPTIKTIPATDTAKFTYVIGVKGSDATTTYDTTVGGKTPYQQLYENLKGRDAATYTVTVTVSCDNYNALTKTVEVEIKQATNVWTANAPATSLARAYENTSFVMATPVPKHGKVTYTYDGGTTTEDISVVNAWINGLSQSTTPYVITVSVPETANYTGLTVRTELTVTGTIHAWDNQSELIATYNFQFGTSLVNDLKGMKFPYHACTNAQGGSVKYTVNYTDFDDKSDVKSFNTMDELKNHLGANAHAGVYVIEASYTHVDTNITTVPYQITVNVSRATAAWDEEIRTEYINVYEAVEMPTPTAGASVVTVTVLDSDKKPLHSLPAGGDLTAYLNKQNVGTYYVLSEVKATNDFTGLAEVETRVVITPATNTWVDTSVLQSLWTFKRNQEINVGIPTSLRGTVSYSLDGKGIVLDEGDTLNDYLNKHAQNDLDARDHTLRFYVAAGDHGNYNGLAYDCTLRIVKNENGWKEAPVSAYPNWTGTVNVSDFKIPTPDFYANLLHFDIEKVVGPATVVSSYDMNENEFKAALAKLVNGTYRVTMRVGGSCSNPNHKTDDFTALKVLLDTYNADYYELTGTTVITIAPKANKWNDSLVADSTIEWTYGATNNQAVNFNPENADNMEIRVNNEKITIPDGSTLNDYLKANYGVGRHLIKATVPANDVYNALEKVITLEIKKSNANGWEERTTVDGTTIMNLKLNGTWIWDNATRSTQGWTTIGLVAPVPRFGNGVEVTVRAKNGGELFTVTLTYAIVDGVKTVNQNDYELLRNRLGALDVGEYTATAKIPEDDNYEAFSQAPVAFEITIAENAWKSASDAPHISGWDFSGSTAYPASDPKYGNKNDVVYSYAPVIISEGNTDDDACLNVGQVTTWDTRLPVNAGRYYVRGVLAGTTNYNELVGYGTFSINAGANEWVDMPGVIAWNWNGFNKDVNQFSASVRSGGTVTFSILKQGESESGYVSVGVNDFYVYNGNQLTANDVKVLEKFGFTDGKSVSDAVATALKALKPGTYRLRAVAASTENFGSLEGYVPFIVGKADNEWVTAPNVLSYGYGAFAETGERKNLTVGVAKYGTENIYYQINNSEGEAVLDKTQSVTVLTNKLKALPAGNYVLRAWIPATENDVYKALLSETAPYLVLFGVTRTTENKWAGDDFKPKTPLSEFYTKLHKDDFDFATWFGNPKTVDNAKIVYTLLNTDLTPAKAGEYTYGTLFAAIKELNSGDYVVRLTAKSDNYLDLTADISLTIKRSPNDFSLSDNLLGQWRKDGDVFLTTVDDLTFTADNLEDASFILENKPYTSFDALKQAIQSEGYNAGTYQLTVRVPDTNAYEGFTATVRLEIKQDDNSWKNQWTIENSLGISSSFNTANRISWTYGTQIEWVGARPKYGTLVYVDIRKKGAGEAFSYTDVNYADETAALNAIKNIGKVLSELDGGDYTLTVIAPADVNWKQKSDSVSFSITRASNAWETDNLPHLDGATVNEQGTLSYVYDKLVVAPDASALHGKPVYVYYKEGSDTPLTSVPVNAGKYTVEFIVEETDNYEGLSTSIAFVIAKDTNESFIVSNGTVGWIYGEYDRLTHVFTGIPRTGGEVSYVILDSTGKEVVTGIILGDSNGVHHKDFDKDTYVTVADAAKVGALLAGDYRLQINVAEMPNYEGFSATSPFKITPAQNYWTVTPKITPWSIGLYDAANNLPVAESRFGSPVIKIVSRNNNEVFFDATFNRTTGKYDIAINRLENAPAGMYTMTAKVDIAAGMYNNPLEETVPLEVYKRGSLDEKNYWYDTPGINPWEANIVKLVNKPYGTPLRGLPYFEFYHSKRDANNEIVIDWDNPVVAGEDSFLVAKGTTYFKDFYMPMAPGYYYMVACAESLDGAGNVIAADTLRELPVQFQIRNRENSFKDEPRIGTLLYLGDRDSWAQPTAEPSLLDSLLTFKYKNIVTGEDLGSVMPTKEGRYIVTAYAKAKYSEVIEKSVEFVVELSTNEWTTHPTIEDWSEEYSATAPDPTAVARYGFDEIIYTYENLATGEITTEKPLEEGTYRLTAVAKLANYKDLVGTTTFTIGPAFDFDLLVVDIVLASIACGLTVWIIVLAIKKRKIL